MTTNTHIAAQPTKADMVEVPITEPGMVEVGDTIGFTLCGKRTYGTVKLVLDAGTDREELIYNKKRNFYIITSMAIAGTGSQKNVCVLRDADHKPQALEAAELGEGKAQGRPCKVGGACVATKTSPCACRDLPSPTPPQAPALDAQGELVTVRLPTLTAEQAADVSWCLSAALVDAGRIDDGRMLMFVGEAVTPPPPAVGKPLSEQQIRAEILNTPELHNFSDGVTLEALHQRERWGSEHDAGKAPADWFWLVGYLAGKALHAQTTGNTEKALHHTISTAAALANWHASITGEHTAMRPGIDPAAHGIITKETGK